MKKFIAILLIVTAFCSGCALAAGALAAGVVGGIINSATGSLKNKNSDGSSSYKDLLKGQDVPEIK